MLDSIGVGDLIAVKNVPSRDKFTIVRVKGPYNFKMGVDHDLGHYLPIEKDKVFTKTAGVVPAPFVNALNRAQNAIRITYRHADTVLTLFSRQIQRCADRKIRNSLDTPLK